MAASRSSTAVVRPRASDFRSAATPASSRATARKAAVPNASTDSPFCSAAASASAVSASYRRRAAAESDDLASGAGEVAGIGAIGLDVVAEAGEAVAGNGREAGRRTRGAGGTGAVGADGFAGAGRGERSVAATASPSSLAAPMVDAPDAASWSGSSVATISRSSDCDPCSVPIVRASCRSASVGGGTDPATATSSRMPCTVWPSATASDSRRKASTPTPSPGIVSLRSAGRSSTRPLSSSCPACRMAARAARSIARRAVPTTTVSSVPLRSWSTATTSAARSEASPASSAAAPPIRSNVLAIREANVEAVKLPVSSSSAGRSLSSVCESDSATASGRATPRSSSSRVSRCSISGSRNPICSWLENSPPNFAPTTTPVRSRSTGQGTPGLPIAASAPNSRAAWAIASSSMNCTGLAWATCLGGTRNLRASNV